jgi:hypothetical protein
MKGLLFYLVWLAVWLMVVFGGAALLSTLFDFAPGDGLVIGMLLGFIGAMGGFYIAAWVERKVRRAI